jgi:cell division protein FtsB
MLISRLLNSKIFSLLIISILVYLIFSLIAPLQEKQKLDNQIAQLEKEIQEFQIQQEELQRKEQYFNSEDYLQKEARRLLNYKRPGEEVFSVIPDKGAQSVQEKTDIQEEKIIDSTDKNDKISNIKAWYKYFFKARQ